MSHRWGTYNARPTLLCSCLGGGSRAKAKSASSNYRVAFLGTRRGPISFGGCSHLHLGVKVAPPVVRLLHRECQYLWPKSTSLIMRIRNQILNVSEEIVFKELFRDCIRE